MIKTCQSCGVTFEADKRRTLCDTCRRAYTLEHQREYQRRYRKENPEKVRLTNLLKRLKKLKEMYT